jgi:hypothetical protein
MGDRRDAINLTVDVNLNISNLFIHKHRNPSAPRHGFQAVRAVIMVSKRNYSPACSDWPGLLADLDGASKQANHPVSSYEQSSHRYHGRAAGMR